MPEIVTTLHYYHSPCNQQKRSNHVHASINTMQVLLARLLAHSPPENETAYSEIRTSMKHPGGASGYTARTTRPEQRRISEVRSDHL
jgi:hypothetical protein